MEYLHFKAHLDEAESNQDGTRLQIAQKESKMGDFRTQAHLDETKSIQGSERG